MKKLLIATAAVALVTVGTASAADLAYKAPPPPPPPPSWPGCYVDGGIGYGMWNQDHYLETGSPLTTSFVPVEATSTSGGRGWLGRFGVGCDYQVSPSFVIGAFADYDAMSIKGTFLDGDVPSFYANENESAAWSVGGRIGYLPYPDLMTYISGGWREARFDQMSMFTANSESGFPINTPYGAYMASQTYNGWFLGGGYEYRVPWAAFHGLYWRTEYRFAGYQQKDIPELTVPGNLVFGVYSHVQKYEQTATTSLVWKFNWGSPVVAKY